MKTCVNKNLCPTKEQCINKPNSYQCWASWLDRSKLPDSLAYKTSMVQYSNKLSKTRTKSYYFKFFTQILIIRNM